METPFLRYRKSLFTQNNLIIPLLFWVVYLPGWAGVGVFSGFFPPSSRQWVFSILGCVWALGLIYYFLKQEGSSWADYGLVWQKYTVFRFLGGYLAAVVLFGILLLILGLAGNFTFTSNLSKMDWVGFGLSSVPFIFLAWLEELVFRSYPFVRLIKICGLRLAFYIMAVVFALYHVVSGQDFIGSFLGPGVWAFVFGLAAVWYRGIAVATGLHFGLNHFQGMFGFKPYVPAIWDLVPPTKPGFASMDTIGLGFQLSVLILCLGLVEWTIRRQMEKLKTVGKPQ